MPRIPLTRGESPCVLDNAMRNSCHPSRCILAAVRFQWAGPSSPISINCDEALNARDELQNDGMKCGQLQARQFLRNRCVPTKGQHAGWIHRCFTLRSIDAAIEHRIKTGPLLSGIGPKQTGWSTKLSVDAKHTHRQWRHIDERSSSS